MNLDTNTLEKEWAEKQRTGADRAYFDKENSTMQA